MLCCKSVKTKQAIVLSNNHQKEKKSSWDFKALDDLE